MLKLLLGVVVGILLHCAWCKWGNKCDCNDEILQRLKAAKKKQGKK